MSVERVAQNVGAPFLRKIGMHNLMGGVHARHRCARRRARDPLAGELHKRPFEPILHRAAAGLRLPAVEGRTVIFEDQFEAGHG